MNTEQSNKLRNTQRQETKTTRFYRSFSGADALVFAILPQTEPVLMGSISTLSYSMYRDKKPVPVIGKVNMGGYTRGVRLYAGTMIFTLINQHWINELKDAIPWINHVGVQKIDELPLMDLMVVCANEYGAAMQMMLYGVEVTEEGQVLSVENLFTENTFSFVARDLSNFSNEFLGSNGGTVKIEPTVKYNQLGISQLQTQFTPTYTQGPYELGHQHDFRPTYLIANDEVKKLQEQLNHPSLTEARSPLEVNGWYDHFTFDAVKDFQSQVGLEVTGSLDDLTYEKLVDWIDADDKGELEGIVATTIKTAVVHRKEGAIVKQEPTFKSDTLYTYPPLEQVQILAEQGDWILTHKGYVPKPLLQYNEGSSQVFNPIYEGESNPVNLIIDIQQALGVEATGEYDKTTGRVIRQFQNKYQLYQTNYLDEVTWLALKELVIPSSSNDVYESPCEVKLKRPTEKLSVLYQELIKEAGEYGLTVRTVEPTDVYIWQCSQYKNGERESRRVRKTIEKETLHTISLKDYSEGLIYHIGHQSTPVQLEFAIHIPQQGTYKWHFEIEKGVYHVAS